MPAFKLYRSYICNSRFWSGLSNYFIIPPYFLQAFTQLTPWQTGFVLLSAPLGLVIFSRIAGKYMERFGPKLLMKIGLCVMFIAFVGLSFIQAHWSPYIMVSLLLLYGGGGEFSSLLILHQL